MLADPAGEQGKCELHMPEIEGDKDNGVYFTSFRKTGELQKKGMNCIKTGITVTVGLSFWK